MSTIEKATGLLAAKTRLQLVTYYKDYRRLQHFREGIEYRSFASVAERSAASAAIKESMQEGGCNIVRLEEIDETILMDKDYDKADGKLYSFDYGHYVPPRDHAAITFELRVLLDALPVFGTWANINCLSHSNRLLLAEELIKTRAFRFAGVSHVSFVSLVDRVLIYDHEFVVNHNKIGSPLEVDRSWTNRGLVVIGQLSAKQAAA
jgi:hypothetical protein